METFKGLITKSFVHGNVNFRVNFTGREGDFLSIIRHNVILFCEKVRLMARNTAFLKPRVNLGL